MGLYTHTTRAAGTVVTATIYNGDHQNHIDHQTGEFTLGEALDVTTLRTTADPYASQTTEDVSASDSIQRDIRHLRYILGQLASYCNGGPGTAAATTALGSALGQWYFGIRNPGFKALGCSIQKNSAFTHTATDTFETVSFTTADTTEGWDQDGAGTGFHEGATNPTRITVPANAGGKYLVFAVGEFASSVTGDRRGLRVRKNGATVVINADGPHNTTFIATSTLPINVSQVISLAAADYLELQSVQDIAANSTVVGPGGTAGPVFGVHCLGA
jgi:hypothetical protein